MVKNLHTIIRLTIIAWSLITAQAQATLLTNPCSAGLAVNGISVTDVVGNQGGSSDCFGTFDGNNPDSDLTYGDMSWSFVTKVEIGSNSQQITTGENIGLFLVFDSALSGEWYYDSNLFSSDSFIIVLKAANSPGWAAYLFDGTHASSTFGIWSVAWNRALSHMSVYAKTASIPSVSEPGSMPLLFLTLLLIYGFRRLLVK